MSGDKSTTLVILFLVVVAVLIGAVNFMSKRGLKVRQPAQDYINDPFAGRKKASQKLTTSTAEFCEADSSGAKLSVDEALAIANNSACAREGAIKEDCSCNEGTGTCWLDIDSDEAGATSHQGCNPACVVNVETKKAEVNWRCTGLIAD